MTPKIEKIIPFFYKCYNFRERKVRTEPCFFLLRNVARGNLLPVPQFPYLVKWVAKKIKCVNILEALKTMALRKKYVLSKLNKFKLLNVTIFISETIHYSVGK